MSAPNSIAFVLTDVRTAKPLTFFVCPECQRTNHETVQDVMRYAESFHIPIDLEFVPCRECYNNQLEKLHLN